MAITVLGLASLMTSVRYWTSKQGGNALITYFDLDRQGYRTAKGSWKVRY